MTPAAATRGVVEELSQTARALEGADAETIVGWAVRRFDEGLVVSASFQDCVLIDVATRVAPDVEVVFLDTQYHFTETLDYVEQVRRRYGLNLRVVRPTVSPDDRWRNDPDGCCRVRKVEPLRRVLTGKTAWMTGVRRAEAPSRAGTPVVTWDAVRGLAKINPLATWSDEAVRAYARAHDLPEHPLAHRGFPSIGCWPCTRAVPLGADPRSGRWAGRDKTECGLHVDD